MTLSKPNPDKKCCYNCTRWGTGSHVCGTCDINYSNFKSYKELNEKLAAKGLHHLQVNSIEDLRKREQLWGKILM